MSTRGPVDPADDTPQRLGLPEQLAAKAPPEWMDQNIRAMAQEQARVNAQRGAHGGGAKAVRSVRRQWLPWAGSLAGVAVVVLMVTGAPDKPSDVVSDTPVAVLPSTGGGPAADAPLAAAPDVPTVPAAPAKAAARNERPAPEPTAVIRKPAQQAGSVNHETSSTAPRAANADEPTDVKTAPRATPQSPVGAANDSAASTPASRAPAAAAVAENAAPQNADSAASGAPYRATDSARHAQPAQMAKRARVIPETPEACSRELEDDVRMDRLTSARELFRLCRERFPEYAWSPGLRERLDVR